MRSAIIGAGILCLVVPTAQVSAQSLFERCEKKKAEIEKMEQDVRRIESDMVNIDTQMRELQRRQADLRRDKSAKARQKSSLLQRIKSEQARRARMCRPLQQCESYERKVENLRSRMGPANEKLRRIRDEMHKKGSDIEKLSREVNRIENSYSQLACDNLVPGQTSQTTIDRCSDLFSSWNKLQADINTLRNWLRSLRNRYQQVMRQMRAYQTELASLQRKMRQACAHSDRLAELEQIEKEQHGYRSMRDEFDSMENKFNRFKKLQIVRPKLKPAKREDKPRLKPKKKKKNKHRLKPAR